MKGTTAPTTVVVVNFEAGKSLASCVRSVLASSAPVEAVVVDNGSRDDSLAALRRALSGDPRLRIVENGANLGFAAAANRGLALARGPFALLLNPDAVIAPDTIARMSAVMEEHPDAGLAGGLLLNPDGSEQRGGRRDFPSPGRAFVRAFGLSRVAARSPLGPRDFVRAGDPLPAGPAEVDAISGAFMFARLAAIAQVGPLDEGYVLHCEDLDWCERFRRVGWRVVFVPDVRVVHEKGVSSRRRPLFVLWHKHRGMVRYYRKFLRDDHPTVLFALVVAGVALRFAALAPGAALAGTWGRLSRGASRERT